MWLVSEPPTHLLDLCHIGERANERLWLNLRPLGRCDGGRAMPRRKVRDRGEAADRGATGGLAGLAAGVDSEHEGAGIVVAGGGKVWVVVPARVRGHPIPSGSLHNG